MDNRFTQFRIVADSAADLTSLEDIAFSAVPLKVITAEKEYHDVEGLDVEQMVDELKVYKGKSGSSCPSPDEWLKAFGDAKYIFGVAITSGLSGCYNSAKIAKGIYEAEHPERHVYLVDSLSAGPGETILVEKLEELIVSGMEFDDICREIESYRKKTGLTFVLESLTNFANNGRVSPAVAKLAGMLGIRLMCKASKEGTIEPIDKCRGEKRAHLAIIENLRESGFKAGKIRIAHCFNESGALALKEKILEQFHAADVRIHRTMGLCSFYAERGGLLVAYEIG